MATLSVHETDSHGRACIIALHPALSFSFSFLPCLTCIFCSLAVQFDINYMVKIEFCSCDWPGVPVAPDYGFGFRETEWVQKRSNLSI
jgi:hypothetical protein